MSGLAHPEWAGPVLAGWLLLAALVALADARARRAFRRLVGARMGGWPHGDLLLLAALAAIAVALVGPKLGHERIAIPATGIDVVLLTDVSRSMDARDVAPSRLARARRTGEEVLARLRGGDRAALAVFAGDGALLTPLTPDTGALAEMLAALDTSLMSDTGSELARGIEAAVDAFGDDLRPRAILVLSDGETASPALDEALALATDAAVRVVAVAVGSDAGTTIPDGRGDLVDGHGEIVVTRRETAALEQLADATGGALLRTDRFGAVDAGALVAALERGTRPTASGEVVREIPVARAWIPATLALTLLVLEWIGTLRRTPARAPTPRSLRAAATAGLAALLVAATPADELAHLEARVAERPEDPNALIELGIARAALGDVGDAERAFVAAAVRARDPKLAALAYYDLGVAALEAGDPARAADAFYDAIALDPSLRAAKFNLEWALAALEREEPPPPPPGEGPADLPEEAPREEPEPDAETSDEGAETRDEEAEKADPSAPERLAPPREISEPEARQWLDQVHDDPSRALRSAMPADEDRPRGGPRW